MKFFVRHWYDIAGVLVIPVALWAWLGDWSTVQLILVLNLGVLFVHQFEEYRFPGGEPWVLNEVVMPKGPPVDRKPTNQLSGVWVNGTAWVFYIVPIFLPDVVWLGLAPILFGAVLQVYAHAFLTNVRLKAFYNPGLVAVMFGHLPLGIWYMVEVYQQGLIQWWDWAFGVVYMAFFMVVVIQIIGFRVIAPRGAANWAYSVSEFTRWDRTRRLERAGIAPGEYPVESAEAIQSV